MIFGSKKGVVWKELLGIIVMLLLLALIAWIIFDQLAPSGSAALETCIGGAWSKEPCDTSVSMQNPTILPKLSDNIKYYCCVPKGGLQEQFEQTYRDELDNPPGSETSSGSGSGSESGSTTSKSIQFLLNDEPIDLVKSNTYTSVPPLNGVILAEDKQTFVIEQNIQSTLQKKIGKCRLTVRPAEKKTIGGKEIFSQAQTASGDNFVVEVIQEKCERSITASNITLSLLNTTAFKDPGFYKWDFAYWDEGNKEIIGSETTYIEIKGGSSGGTSSTSGNSNYDIKLTRYFERSTGDNFATCYLSIAVEDKYGVESLPSVATYKIQGESESTITGYPENVILNPGESVTFTFEEEGAEGSPFTYSYDFTDCDTIIVTDLAFYRNNYQRCSNMICDYAKKECREPDQRSGGQCYTDIENCYWDTDFPVGACISCVSKQITTCQDYDNEKSCESNQCFGTGSLQERCFHQAGTGCKTCMYGEHIRVCEEYQKREDCKDDPCQYASLQGISCDWINGKCEEI